MGIQKGLYITFLTRFLIILCCTGIIFLHYNRGDASDVLPENSSENIPDIEKPGTGEPSESEHITPSGINVVKSDITGVRNYEKNYPPLIDACYKGILEKVKGELEGGADPNMRAFDGTVPLHYVCRNGDDTNSMKILDLLIQYGARARVRDTSGYTPLHLYFNIELLARRNYVWGVLIKNGAQVNVVTNVTESSVRPGKQDKRGYSVLETLVNNYDRLGVVDCLVQWGWQLTKQIRDRARNYANDIGFRDIADEFEKYDQIVEKRSRFERGTDVALWSKLKDFAFSEGMRKNTIGELRGIIKRSDERTWPTLCGLTPLMVAIVVDDEQAVDAILKNDGQQINLISGDTYKRTALQIAIIQNTVSIVEKLLAAGANVAAVDWQKNSPLHIVAWLGDIAVQKRLTSLLIKAGGQLNAVNEKGDTLLHRAIRLRDSAYVAYLLATYGQQINKKARNIEGLTPYGLAEKLKLDNIMKLLNS